MFSYFNINIKVGAVYIQIAPAFPEKMAQVCELTLVHCTQYGLYVCINQK
jgi:hypothetical protein